MINRGFSLVEAIIYIALLGLLMAGAITSSYQIAQNSHLLSGKNTVQEEGNFVLRKIDWAMSGVQSIDASLVENLFITRHDGVVAHFQRNTATDPYSLSLSTVGSAVPITTENVNVDAFDITHIPASGSAPEGFTLTLTLDGVEFVTTKYVR